MSRFGRDAAPVVLVLLAGLAGCEPVDDSADSGSAASTEPGSASDAVPNPAITNPAITDPVVDATWTIGDTADGTWSIAWRPVGGVIPPLDPFSVEVVVRDPSGGPIPDEVGVLVDATMPHHGHGMNVEPRIARTGDAEDGATFVADGMLLHMPGRWEFTVDVVRGDEVERAQWTVTLDD